MGMQIGMIGLGRMGANMTRRLMRAGHACVVYAPEREAVEAMVKEGASGAADAGDLLRQLRPPRVVWLMVPAAAVDGVIADLLPGLERGDAVIDGGNSYYRDDIRRAEQLQARGIHYVDCGTSGGVWGLERGYCLMIGGESETVRQLEPIFAALAPGAGTLPRTPGRKAQSAEPHGPELGYLHCGSHGAGHFVKMVHNGIEYGMMAALAEGLNLLRHADVGSRAHVVDAENAPLREPRFYRYEFDLAGVSEVWRRGSVIASWLLDLTAAALYESPALEEYSGHVSDSGEGRWTALAAVEEGVPAHVLTAALYQRFDSRGQGEFQNRALSAMRHAFGGHLEQTRQR